MRGSLQPVAPPELIMLQLQVAQMTAQAVQLVPALGRFRAEFGDGRRCSLPDRAKPPLEVEASEALLIRAQLVEKQAVGVLFGLHALRMRFSTSSKTTLSDAGSSRSRGRFQASPARMSSASLSMFSAGNSPAKPGNRAAPA